MLIGPKYRLQGKGGFSSIVQHSMNWKYLDLFKYHIPVKDTLYLHLVAYYFVVFISLCPIKHIINPCVCVFQRTLVIALCGCMKELPGTSKKKKNTGRIQIFRLLVTLYFKLINRLQIAVNVLQFSVFFNKNSYSLFLGTRRHFKIE